MTAITERTYEPTKFQSILLAVLSLSHYYVTITIIYELGNYNDDRKYHLYEMSLIIIVLCMLILVRLSLKLATNTSHISFIAVLLAPMLSLFMDIDHIDLYYAHLFQTFMIILNLLFHLVVLCINVTHWITILCFLSFMDGVFFIIVAISLLSLTSNQRNKLLPSHLLLEISLLLFAVIVIALRVRNEMFLYFTVCIMSNYLLCNLPFFKSYLIWGYMYRPATTKIFNYIITDSGNNTHKIIHRMYAMIHCMSHHINWCLRSTANEQTKLLSNQHLLLKYHAADTVSCWQKHSKFMDFNVKQKIQFIMQYCAQTHKILRRYIIIIYGLFSVIAYIYPILWLIVSHIATKEQYGFVICNGYQSFVIWFIIIMYTTCLAWTLAFFTKIRWFVYIAMVYYANLRVKYGGIHPKYNAVLECCIRMKQVKAITNNLHSDIASIILIYCYHTTESQSLSSQSTTSDTFLNIYDTFSSF